MLDSNQGQVPALQRSLKDIVNEYTEKCVGAEAEVAAFHAKVAHMDTISTVGGAFVHGFDLRTHLSASDVKRRLLRSAWFDHEGLPGEKYNPDRPYWGRDIWTDLPLGSFRAAGTNVCTGLWRYYKPAEAQK